MAFTPCTTGTVAQFHYGAHKDGDFSVDHMPVEAWDENGVPYVANDCGLSSVYEFAKDSGARFTGLHTTSSFVVAREGLIAGYGKGADAHTKRVEAWDEKGVPYVIGYKGKLTRADFDDDFRTVIWDPELGPDV